jgi:hypothetical protein
MKKIDTHQLNSDSGVIRVKQLRHWLRRTSPHANTACPLLASLFPRHSGWALNSISFFFPPCFFS